LLKSARYKGAHGGRGGGKSFFFAELLVEECVADPNTRAVCIRETLKSLDLSAKQLIEDKIRSMEVGAHFEVLDSEIWVIDTIGRRAGLISFQGMQNHTAESIKSLEGYRIAWVEEAQSISIRSLDLLTPTFRVPGAELWFSWNPNKATDPVDKLFSDNADDPDFLCVEVNYPDNPWFPEDLRRDMERDRKRDPDKYAHIWCGKYERRSEARVFHNWEEREFETPANVRFYFGADWGFSVDPTVLVRCFIDGRTLYVDQEVYQVGCEIDHTPKLFDKIPQSKKWKIRADSARPETISFMQRNGYPNVIPALKGPGSVEDGIEFLKSYDIVVHPRCTHTIDELSFYSWKQDKKTEEILPILEDKENHVIDALRYSVEGARRAPLTISPEALARSRVLGRRR
jgi:phage terminase large subunit